MVHKTSGKSIENVYVYIVSGEGSIIGQDGVFKIATLADLPVTVGDWTSVINSKDQDHWKDVSKSGWYNWVKMVEAVVYIPYILWDEAQSAGVACAAFCCIYGSGIPGLHAKKLPYFNLNDSIANVVRGIAERLLDVL